MELIPKGNGNFFRGIGLLEFLWKFTTSIINRRLNSAICYHDTLHGFWTGCGTKTATLEAKLIQQLINMRKAVLHTTFLVIQKIYDALDCDGGSEVGKKNCEWGGSQVQLS